ncbi:hypothetical protein Acsp03_36940 [Actinomadura sp. NBRC 104412]|uniref:DUF1275 family protein n=1 Tax=Actinomadura sp. NBRC 104412 TaxID=3032203 RepID=UPI0024A24494|nr:YoaK family protein [Actinomadura sp. NBRC 104412]GLZ06228.1 hypothetical protein Acsp03_36940 [Actinomadura sp. NBRC 104412]
MGRTSGDGRADAGALRTACMLALTFSAGVADAAGFLALDRVFVGNMTGNLLILGMAVGRPDGLPVAGPLAALAAFMAGVAIGGRVLRTAAGGWTSRVTALLGVVAGIMAACATVDLVRPVAGGSPEGVLLAAMLACALGIQAATAHRVAVPDVTTVVITSTITVLASASRSAAGSGQAWVRRSSAIAALALGAVAGALLLRVGLAACVGLAVLVTVLSTAAGHATRARRAMPPPAG